MATVLTLDGLVERLANEPTGTGIVRQSTVTRWNNIAACRAGDIIEVTESGRDKTARKSTTIATAYRRLLDGADDIDVVPLKQAGHETECLLVPAGMHVEAMTRLT